MNSLQQYLKVWAFLFVIYLFVGVAMEMWLRLFQGNWFELMAMVFIMPTAVVGGYGLSRLFHRR